MVYGIDGGDGFVGYIYLPNHQVVYITYIILFVKKKEFYK